MALEHTLTTWTPKVCHMVAFMAIMKGLGLLFYILLGFRYCQKENGVHRIGDTFWGSPKSIIVVWDQYWGPPILGKLPKLDSCRNAGRNRRGATKAQVHVFEQLLASGFHAASTSFHIVVGCALYQRQQTTVIQVYTRSFYSSGWK